MLQSTYQIADIQPSKPAFSQHEKNLIQLSTISGTISALAIAPHCSHNTTRVYAHFENVHSKIRAVIVYVVTRLIYSGYIIREIIKAFRFCFSAPNAGLVFATSIDRKNKRKLFPKTRTLHIHKNDSHNRDSFGNKKVKLVGAKSCQAAH